MRIYYRLFGCPHHKKKIESATLQLQGFKGKRMGFLSGGYGPSRER